MEASAIETIGVLGTSGVDFGGVWKIGRLIVRWSHQ